MDQQVYEKKTGEESGIWLSYHILECWYDSIGLVNIYRRYRDANMFFIFELNEMKYFIA
jgi:hypothetical protein